MVYSYEKKSFFIFALDILCLANYHLSFYISWLVYIAFKLWTLPPEKDNSKFCYPPPKTKFGGI